MSWAYNFIKKDPLTQIFLEHPFKEHLRTANSKFPLPFSSLFYHFHSQLLATISCT